MAFVKTNFSSKNIYRNFFFIKQKNSTKKMSPKKFIQFLVQNKFLFKLKKNIVKKIYYQNKEKKTKDSTKTKNLLQKKLLKKLSN